MFAKVMQEFEQQYGNGSLQDIRGDARKVCNKPLCLIAFLWEEPNSAQRIGQCFLQ